MKFTFEEWKFIQHCIECAGREFEKMMLDTVIVDEQTVATAADLVANDYVKFKAGATLAATAATPLADGENGKVDGTAYQTYLDKIESYTYNTMGVVVTDDTTKGLFASFVKRLRDEMGIKFQLVLYNKAADYYGTTQALLTCLPVYQVVYIILAHAQLRRLGQSPDRADRCRLAF